MLGIGQIMKRKIELIAAMGAAGALLAACGGNDYGGGDVGYVGPVALDDCAGYYDDFYGPFDDGCWADDGAFWYRGHGDHGWRRDGGGHFAHAGGPACTRVHPHGPGAGFHFGGGHGGGGHAGGGDHH